MSAPLDLTTPGDEPLPADSLLYAKIGRTPAVCLSCELGTHGDDAAAAVMLCACPCHGPHPCH